MDQKNIMEKESNGAQVSLPNLMVSVASFSLLGKLAENGILWRNYMKFPPFCMDEVAELCAVNSSCI